MSYFIVMVVTKNGTNKELEQAMAPFHEFSCTGLDNEFVQNIDKLPEAKEEYKTATTSRYKAPDGSLHSTNDDQFYREPTPEELKKMGIAGGTGFGNGISWTSKDWGDGRGYRAKVHFMPEGWQEIEVKQSDVCTLAEYIEYNWGREAIEGDAPLDMKDKHKYGWCRVKNGEVVEFVERDNPNHKWDWWTEGGHWPDYFVPKAGTKATATHGRKRDIDFASMRARRSDEAGAVWDEVRAVVGNDFTGHKTWAIVRDAHKGDMDAARKEYNEQPMAVKFNKWDGRGFGDLVEDYAMQREDYARAAALRATTPFAFLMDGKWAAKGDMGWWACVSDEKENWPGQFADLLGNVPDNHFLTIVDCHT